MNGRSRQSYCGHNGSGVCMATAMVVFLLLHTVKANGCSGNVTADIVFVMDASGSVGSENFQRMREFVRDLVDALDIGPNNIRVGVQKYSSGTNTEFNLSDYYDKEDMKNATMSIVYTGGSTNTGTTRYFSFFHFHYFIVPSLGNSGRFLPVES
ncbi:cartilage matrix protein-like [Littorina saxatilis]|uniref:cartilage matrix protein-like n=1 Tax=Littorina saxatilis TaxID=31220 RepID=UPI0038B65023